MKKLFTLMLTIILASTLVYAQKKKGDAVEEKPDAGRFKWGESKLIPKLKKLAITELTVNYKLTTTAKTVVQEKSSRTIAGARVTAYLETTDGELTEADFQQITDHFYTYFQRKLKEAGIDTVAWSTITASDFYQKIGGDDDEKDDAKKEGGGNEWVVSTAHKGKIVHSGMTGFAGGKGKRSVAFVDDLDATAASFKVNVDFADVVVNLDIKTKPAGWYYPSEQTNKYTWGVNAQMRVGDPENKLRTMICGTKGWPELLTQWTDIPVEGSYAESMTEDVSKARSGLAKQFAFRKELTPMLIQTTREKYKAAASHAVEKWVDAFVTRTVQMRKG